MKKTLSLALVAALIALACTGCAPPVDPTFASATAAQPTHALSASLAR
ncbi:hypothetical protein ACFQ4Q_07400 [Lysobacter gummosus]